MCIGFLNDVVSAVDEKFDKPFFGGKDFCLLICRMQRTLTGVSLSGQLLATLSFLLWSFVYFPFGYDLY